MANNQESGIALNVANFQNLINLCTSFGTAYNPSSPHYTVEALTQKLEEVKAVLKKVNTEINAYNDAISAREQAFAPLSKLVTRIFNAVQFSGVSESVVNDFKPMVRKLRGERAKPIPRKDPSADPAIPTARTVSASQLSYENKLMNFEALVSALSSLEAYAPNEKDLKVESLEALLETLREKHLAAQLANTELFMARNERNVLMFDPNSGIVYQAMAVKKYVKSLFGTGSNPFKEVNSLMFRIY